MRPMKIHHYRGWQYWYDYHVKTWYAAEFDKDGNQLGEAMDAYRKSGILLYIDMIENNK